MDEKEILVKMQRQVEKMQESTESLLNAVDLQQAYLKELAETVREAIRHMDSFRSGDERPH